MSTQSTLVETPPTIQLHPKAKYWLLTINFNLWRIPETIYDNIKYIRGQLEYSEHQYLHWQIAVQYFNPTNFQQVRKQFSGAHIEPIYSVSAWNYVWKEITSIDGTQFEMGDKSDLIKEMEKRHIKTLTIRNPIINHQEPVELENVLDLECLGEKMMDLSENLHFLPSNLLKEISDVITKAETNLLLDEAAMAVVEPQDLGLDLSKPRRNGKKWQLEEIKELESMLKSNSTVEDIANHFQRSNNSIRLKAAALVAEKTNNGCSLKTALMEYGGKIYYHDIQRFEILKNRKLNRKRIVRSRTRR